MSQKFNKSRNSHQRALCNETWSPGEGQYTKNYFRAPKPLSKQFSNQPEVEVEGQQFKQPLQQKSQLHILSKPPKHRRRQSQNERIQKQLETDPIVYSPPLQSAQITPNVRRSSEKRYSMGSSNKQIQQRFQQIQSIMGIENENLRKQKDYLLNTIYKMQMRQKQYKNQILNHKNKALQLEMQNKLLRDKYTKARQFIANGIGKMQQAISKEQQEEDNSNKNTAHHSNESSINVSQQIEELNDKFDAMMYEYQKTRQPQLRKQCIQIAKQLKRLRKLEEENNSHLPRSMTKKQSSKKQ